MTRYFVLSACPYKFACSHAFQSDVIGTYHILMCTVYSVRSVSIYIISNYILYACIRRVQIEKGIIFNLLCMRTHTAYYYINGFL